MKQKLMVIGLAYAALGAVVYLALSNSPDLPVCDVSNEAGRTIVTLGWPSNWPVECDSESCGAMISSCVTDCGSETDCHESDTTADDVVFVHPGSAFSLDLIDDTALKQSEASDSDKEDSDPSSSKSEKDCGE